MQAGTEGDSFALDGDSLPCPGINVWFAPRPPPAQNCNTSNTIQVLHGAYTMQLSWSLKYS